MAYRNKKAKKYNIDMIINMGYDYGFNSMRGIDELRDDLEDIFNHYH